VTNHSYYRQKLSRALSISKSNRPKDFLAKTCFIPYKNNDSESQITFNRNINTFNEIKSKAKKKSQHY
jgi:hypothetical protein